MLWFRRVCKSISKDRNRDNKKNNDDIEEGIISHQLEQPPQQPQQPQQQQQNTTNIHMSSTTGGEEMNAVQALTDEEVEDCKEAFAVFVDVEGLVDIQNLGAMMRALGDKASEDEIQALTDKYDHTHFERGGKIDFLSFMAMMKPRIIKANEMYNDVSMGKLFKEFDADGDGYISAGELRQSLQKLGDKFAAVADELTDEDVEEIMIESDLDGDGRISYSEFSIMVPRLNKIIDE
mmetsp:Transcript_9461/g.14097  ORF Transcript_9461/g.14097 Transcript_9461/m.14097 type:complete len:235 (+) Transcript_9461:169-873(+)